MARARRPAPYGAAMRYSRVPDDSSGSPRRASKAIVAPSGDHDGALRGPEVATHLEAAISVAAGLADAAVGLRAAAETIDLDFVPLAWEPFDLALPEEALGAADELLSALGSAPAMPGFDLADAGAVTRL